MEKCVWVVERLGFKFQGREVVLTYGLVFVEDRWHPLLPAAQEASAQEAGGSTLPPFKAKRSGLRRRIEEE